MKRPCSAAGIIALGDYTGLIQVFCNQRLVSFLIPTWRSTMRRLLAVESGVASRRRSLSGLRPSVTSPWLWGLR